MKKTEVFVGLIYPVGFLKTQEKIINALDKMKIDPSMCAIEIVSGGFDVCFTSPADATWFKMMMQ